MLDGTVAGLKVGATSFILNAALHPFLQWEKSVPINHNHSSFIRRWFMMIGSLSKISSGRGFFLLFQGNKAPLFSLSDGLYFGSYHFLNSKLPFKDFGFLSGGIAGCFSNSIIHLLPDFHNSTPIQYMERDLRRQFQFMLRGLPRSFILGSTFIGTYNLAKYTIPSQYYPLYQSVPMYLGVALATTSSSRIAQFLFDAWKTKKSFSLNYAFYPGSLSIIFVRSTLLVAYDYFTGKI